MIETLCAIAFGFFCGAIVFLPVGIVAGGAIYSAAYSESTRAFTGVACQALPLLERIAEDARAVKEGVFNDMRVNPDHDFDPEDERGGGDGWRGR